MKNDVNVLSEKNKHKDLEKKKFFALFWIWDVYPGSPDPDFYPSLILDPGSRILDPGSKNCNEREG
jgi:hypothetical protein